MVDKLIYGGEPILPDRDSYRPGVSFGALVSDIGSGPVRSRGLYRNNSVNTSVTYTLTANQLQYFMDTYYGALREGQLPIEVRLDLTASDLADETWYVATIIQAPSAAIWTGIYAQITVVYNAVPLIDRAVSASRQVAYEALGDYAAWDITHILDPLERLL